MLDVFYYVSDILVTYIIIYRPSIRLIHVVWLIIIYLHAYTVNHVRGSELIN